MSEQNMCTKDVLFKAYLVHSLSQASLAQLAARQSHNLKVVSSSLTRGTRIFFVSSITCFFIVGNIIQILHGERGNRASYFSRGRTRRVRSDRPV